ncbi:MAG: type IV pilus secretin PilQ [Candidatus Aminicenantes bacterium]|nr:type IV pilus secretin PilQ [Candidatus Aminicenantes bacterium]
MKRKNYFKLILVLCIFIVSTAYAQEKESLVNINQISVEPGELKTRIVLDTDSYLPLLNSYYAPESPQTIVIEWNNVKSIKEPRFSPEESPLIQSLKVEKAAENHFRFLVQLKEQVPYRVYSTQERTTVELVKIQRALGKYVIDLETEKTLAAKFESKVNLEKVEIVEKEDRVDVIAKMDGKAFPNIFALGNPLRLIVDLLETLYAAPSATHTVNKMGVRAIRTGQFQTANPVISRIVFDLSQPTLYDVKFDNSNMIISFFKETAYQAPPAVSTLKEAVAELEKETPQPEVAEPEIQEEEKPTPPPQQEPPPEEEPTAQVQMPTFEPRAIRAPEEQYTGEVLDLKVKDADLRDVVIYLGEFAGLNVAFDPEVAGKVTADLEAVPWDQILDLVLKLNKMGKVLEGNVLRVAPISVLTREQEQKKQLARTKEEAGVLETYTKTLSYSKARDVQGLLRNKLSPRGAIIIDERTNTLIITDVEEKLELINDLITVVDLPTPQVSIEARILEATANFIRNLGIQWGFRGIVDPFYGNQTSFRFPNSGIVDGAVIPQGPVTKGLGGPLGGYAVNLPAPAFNSAIGITMGNVLDTFRLDVALSALETSGEGEIISCPRVTTQNNRQAEIIQGRQIPVQTVSNFTVTTQYRNAALELRVTPQITAEGTIIMDIDIRNNAPDFANLVNGIPPITTQSASTTVMIQDGGTTVIGGIYRTEDTVTRERVPFLHKIPILGALFRNSSKTKVNRELLIFMTPRILK